MTVEEVDPQYLAIHDTAPVVEGSTPRDALRRALDLACLGDRLGYRRYWAAETHGMRGAASCAPAVLAGRIAASTDRIRVGAGGVLLPYHSPLVVSEQFGTLEALHPGRIDLAIGRGAGAAPAVRDAVNPRRDAARNSFSAEVDRLRGYFQNEVHEGVRAVPAFGNSPQLWMLGSSAGSAILAAEKDLPYAFGGFYNRNGAESAGRTYQMHARRPYLGIWVGVIAADTAEEAEYLAGSYRLKNASSTLWGRKRQLPSAEVAVRERPKDPGELAVFYGATEGFVIGDGFSVRRELARLRRTTGADELILRTPVHDPEAKMRSFSLIADV
ncbi:MsnO8 family LLM class oxidoreductase [Pseudonocardia alni]|uniref:MsnO8 family LLM class oxidoreductase n=1 Tax=Pseudonocardia alni TaxID=33907 RepID=UPI0036BC7A46